MKTKISIAILLVLTVLFLAGCQSSAGAAGNTPAALLTEAEARDIALKDVGISVSDVTFLHIEKEADDGITKYDVSFRHGDYEYNYEVDAAAGKIIGFDKDLENAPAVTDPAATEPTPTEAPNKAITEAEAKKIALDHAGLKEADVTRLTVKKDSDDGRAHYDVEFFKGDYEYDYDIDAATGKIVDHSKEKEAVKTSATTKPPATTKPATTKSASSKTITKSKAQSVALNHAGLKASEVTGLRVSLDKDDGRTYYEVDFRKGNVEYDYEIDAVTGKVVEWDKDIDD